MSDTETPAAVDAAPVALPITDVKSLMAAYKNERAGYQARLARATDKADRVMLEGRIADVDSALAGLRGELERRHKAKMAEYEAEIKAAAEGL